MRLIVSGSRNLNQDHHREWVYRVLDEMEPSITELVTGMALYWKWKDDPNIGGPDRFGYDWAKLRGKEVIPFYPDWSKGKGAGKLRNVEMARYGEACVAFWDGDSGGTDHMIRFMKMLDKPVRMEQESLEISLFDD